MCWRGSGGTAEGEGFTLTLTLSHNGRGDVAFTPAPRIEYGGGSPPEYVMKVATLTT